VASIPTPPAPPPARLAFALGILVATDDRGNVAYYTSTSAIVHDARLVGGYAGLTPSRELRYGALKALQVASTSHLRLRDRYLAVPQPLPRFRLVTRAEQSDDPARAIKTIDVATTALVDRPLSLEGGSPGEVEVREDLPGRIELTTRAPTRQLLVVSESFHAGWRPRIDGTEMPLLRVYGDFMGAVVEPGTHRVALRFEPQSLRIGGALSAAGLVLVLLGAARAGVARRSTDPNRGRAGTPWP
jgi:hypothetical protein